MIFQDSNSAVAANESNWRMWRLKDEYESRISRINLWNSWVTSVPSVSPWPHQAAGTNAAAYTLVIMFRRLLGPDAGAQIWSSHKVLTHALWTRLLSCSHYLPSTVLFLFSCPGPFFSWELHIIHMLLHPECCCPCQETPRQPGARGASAWSVAFPSPCLAPPLSLPGS